MKKQASCREQTDRVVDIIKRLYTLEKLSSSELAQEYSVSHRTIHRDFTEKIAKHLPLQNNRGIWQLDTTHLQKSGDHFNQEILFSFAKNMGLNVNCIDKKMINDDMIHYAISYKKLPKALGEQISQAIKRQKVCQFIYQKPNSSSRREASAILLYTENSIWYMVAQDHKDDNVKTFKLSKIKNFSILEKNSDLSVQVRKEASKIANVWYDSSKEKQQIELYIKLISQPTLKRSPCIGVRRFVKNIMMVG